MDGITWYYVVRTVDCAGNMDTNTNAVSEPGGSYQKHNLGTLSSTTADGWNFVSFNVDANGDNYAQADDLGEILEDTEYGVAGNYDKAVYYDAANDGWKSYVPGRAAHYNDLSAWDRTMGIWIHMTSDDDLSIEGTAPTSTDITLYPGWNMVGYPSSTAGAGTDLPAEVTRVGYYDSAATYNLGYATTEGDVDAMTLNAGEGYWLYVDGKSSVLWTVNY